jgi:hypothetical protein
MRQWLLIFCLMLILLTMGCDQARNKFNQVHLGMSKVDVLKILGKPQETKTPKAGELLTWNLGSRTITLQINHDRIVGKQLSKPAPQSPKAQEKKHV